MENINKQHVQLPNNMTRNLSPQEILIYMSIKRYMDGKTKEAFPSLETIKIKSGASIPTIRKCIDKLVKTDYIKVRKQGRKNIYTFLKWREFEPISYDFLDKEDLSFMEKAYIAVSQQYMYKDVEGVGKISFNNKDLSSQINLSESTISRCNHSLKSKGYLTIIENNLRDLETGCKTNTKIFNLFQLGQSIIWKLKEHEERIEENTTEITKIKERLDSAERLLRGLEEKQQPTKYIMT